MADETYDAYVRTDPPVFDDLRRLLPVDRARVVFDVGACEGEDSLRYARLFPHARVYAFEPLSANQRLIQGHFARHGTTRCELVPVALSDKDGQAVLHVSSGSPEEKPHGEDWNYGNKSSSLLPPAGEGPAWVPWLKFTREETVPTLTLDHFCAERGIRSVDLVHIDVQGAEYLVLSGAGAMLPRIGALWIEVADAEVYQGQRVRTEVDRLLARRGFKPVRRVVNGVESDVLYVNLRRLPGLRLWLGRRLRETYRDGRFYLSRFVHSLLRRS